MKLTEFLLKTTHKDLLTVPPCIINVMVPAQVPILFMQAFVMRMQTLLQRPLVRWDTSRQSCAEMQASLSTSFLGSSFVYSISSELTKQDQVLLTFLEAYCGMHTVIMITKQEYALRERPEVMHIALNEEVTSVEYAALYQFLSQDVALDTKFVQELFRRVPHITLDAACILMHYQQLLGKNNQQFFSAWFHRIIEQKQSLFLLSQYFFARDRKNFYTAWNMVASEYPPEFWIAFWAEQLWQALIFVTIAQSENAVVAKKSVSRLPFAFMQKDWSKHSREGLTQAHDLLSLVDYSNKNGSVVDGFALFYAHCLL